MRHLSDEAVYPATHFSRLIPRTNVLGNEFFKNFLAAAANKVRSDRSRLFFLYFFFFSEFYKGVKRNLEGKKDIGWGSSPFVGCWEPLKNGLPLPSPYCSILTMCVCVCEPANCANTSWNCHYRQDYDPELHYDLRSPCTIIPVNSDFWSHLFHSYSLLFLHSLCRVFFFLEIFIWRAFLFALIPFPSSRFLFKGHSVYGLGSLFVFSPVFSVCQNLFFYNYSRLRFINLHFLKDKSWIGTIWQVMRYFSEITI